MSETSIAHQRAQSRKIVQLTFGAIAAVTLALSLGFHLQWIGTTLPTDDVAIVARAFLLIATLDTAMMFAWEDLFGGDR